MAKRHNMCWDKRHSDMHSNKDYILLSLYYHVYYDVSLTFFFGSPCMTWLCPNKQTVLIKVVCYVIFHTMFLCTVHVFVM